MPGSGLEATRGGRRMSCLLEPFQEGRTATPSPRPVSRPDQPENESEGGENESHYTDTVPAGHRPRIAGKRGTRRAADKKHADEQTVQPSARGRIHQVDRTPA